jgi:hypothetical protein
LFVFLSTFKNKQEIQRFKFENLQKFPFGEGHVQDPIPALQSHGRIPGRHIVLSLYSNFQLLGAEMAKKLGTDGRTGERFHYSTFFFKRALKKYSIKFVT